MEFFTAEKVRDGAAEAAAAGTPAGGLLRYAGPLARRPLARDRLLVELLAQEVLQSAELRAFLLRLLDASRGAEAGSARELAAANAITVLAEADHDFFGADLRGVAVAGADLSAAALAAADLQGARLAGCTLTSASLAGADLRGADLHSLSFAQFVDVPGRALGASADARCFAAADAAPGGGWRVRLFSEAVYRLKGGRANSWDGTAVFCLQGPPPEAALVALAGDGCGPGCAAALADGALLAARLDEGWETRPEPPPAVRLAPAAPAGAAAAALAPPGRLLYAAASPGGGRLLFSAFDLALLAPGAAPPLAPLPPECAPAPLPLGPAPRLGPLALAPCGGRLAVALGGRGGGELALHLAEAAAGGGRWAWREAGPLRLAAAATGLSWGAGRLAVCGGGRVEVLEAGPGGLRPAWASDGPVECAAFLPDGGAEGTVHDARPGAPAAPLLALRGDAGRPVAALFPALIHSDTLVLVAAGASPDVDSQTFLAAAPPAGGRGRLRRVPPLPAAPPGAALALAFSPSGRRLALRLGRAALLFDLDRGSACPPLDVGPPASLAPPPDPPARLPAALAGLPPAAPQLLALSDAGAAALSACGRRLLLFPASGGCSEVALGGAPPAAPAPRLFLAGPAACLLQAGPPGGAALLRAFALADGRPLAARPLPLPGGAAAAALDGAHGRACAAALAARLEALVCEPAAEGAPAALVARPAPPAAELRCVAVGPGGRRLACGLRLGSRGAVWVLDAASGQLAFVLEEGLEGSPPAALCFSGEPAALLAAAAGGGGGPPAVCTFELGGRGGAEGGPDAEWEAAAPPPLRCSRHRLRRRLLAPPRLRLEGARLDREAVPLPADWHSLPDQLNVALLVSGGAHVPRSAADMHMGPAGLSFDWARHAARAERAVREWAARHGLGLGRAAPLDPSAPP